MNRKRAILTGVLVGFSAMLAGGCGESTEVPLEKTAPVAIPDAKPLPEKPQEGGGKGSSGNMNRNPGGNT
jgi:hypothetical protein